MIFRISVPKLEWFCSQNDLPPFVVSLVAQNQRSPRGRSKRPLSGRATAVPIREVATGDGSWVVEDDEMRDVLLLQPIKMDDTPQTYSTISK